MGHTLDLDLIGNPLGKRVGGGYTTMRVGDGNRVHIEDGKTGVPLCMRHVLALSITNRRASTARVVDCYRCIKQMSFVMNAPMLDRSLTPGRGGSARSHKMVPGGRQGPLVGARQPTKHTEPPWVTSMKGVDPFPRGSERHPTQTRLRGQVGAAGRASTRESRASEIGQALPRGYFPPITREEETAMLAMRGGVRPAEVYAGKGKARGRKPSQKEVAAAIAAAGGMRANPTLAWVKITEGFNNESWEATKGKYTYTLVRHVVKGGDFDDLPLGYCLMINGTRSPLNCWKSASEARAAATEHADWMSGGRRANPRGRVEIARNGRRFIRLANGQVRFVA